MIDSSSVVHKKLPGTKKLFFHPRETQKVHHKEWETRYPNRYYAHIDPSMAHTSNPVLAWYDMQLYSTFDHLPDDEWLHPVTKEEWDSRTDFRHGVYRITAGKMTVHEPIQAQPTAGDVRMAVKRELSNTRNLLWNEFGSMGEPVPQEWIDYQKALKDILKTTGDEIPNLPTPPELPSS